MDQFEYVMVLVSIIIGLGVAHILLGVGGIIDRLTSEREPLALSLVHATWLVGLFGWMISFWWWEYRFAERITNWTVGLYFFLVLYAVALFLLAVVLVPRTWDRVNSLGEYFLQRRAWCYWLWAFANILDLFDSYLKGGISYIVDETGLLSHGSVLVAVPIAIIGMRTRNMVFHGTFGVMFMLWQYLSAFGFLPTLTMQ
jgi:hypothetical protein